MTRAIHISSPVAGANVPGDFFAASGTATEGVRKITFTLVDSAKKPVNPDDFTIHRHKWSKLKTGPGNLNWIIGFETVPPGNNYMLTVTDAEDSAILDSVTFNVLPPKTTTSHKKSGLHIELITIQSPGANTTIPADNFAPYGTTDELLPMYAVLNVPGASSVMGSLVQGPPTNSNWIFQFSQLPTGTGASLTVYADGGSTSTVTGLTVS